MPFDPVDTYGMGRLEPAPVTRLAQANFLMTDAPEWNPVPSLVSRSHRIGGMLNQNGFPRCVGYTCKQNLIGAPFRTKRGPSADDIYHMAQLIDEWPGEDYQGTSVNAGMKVLHKLGHIREYRWAYDVETAKNWVLAVSPVLLGTWWYESMFSPDPKTGLVKPSGRRRGGHAYYWPKIDGKRGLAWIPNTWGADWGLKGWFCIQLEDLDRLIREDGEAATAFEQLAPKQANG